MTGAPAGAVELLERALSYARTALAGVAPDDLGRPTPCAGWNLAELLTHMDDSLDAFVEAAGGVVTLWPSPDTPLDRRVASLQSKACHLLGRWSRAAAPGTVRVGGVATSSDVVVAAAALEITLHGWDVASSTGGPEIPEQFAAELLPLSMALITERDRGTRFAPALTERPAASASERLLARAGRRRTGPLQTVSPVHGTGPPRAS